MTVPYTFQTATGSIPLSQLDSNFSTGITIGNTSVLLGDTITTINNLSLANVTISSVASAFPNNYLANSNVIVGTTTLTLGNTVSSINGLTLSNVTISSGNVTITNVSVTTANVSGTANVSTLIATGNVTLGDASTDTVTVNGTATFNASPIISVTDNTNAALRITQLGTGNALLVEDLTNPDSTPFVIDASGNVGIGTSSPAYKLDVFSTGSVSAQIAGSTRGTLRLKGSFAGTTDIGHFSVYNALDTRVFDIGTTSDDTATPTSRAEFSVSAAGVSTELMRLSGSVGTVFNEDGGDYDFRVESDTNTHALFVQGSDGNVGIGTSSPTSTLSVTGTANVTGNVTLGDSSTDTVTVSGYMRTGGSAPNANICLRVGNTVTGSTSGFGLHSNAIADSGTTANYYGVYSIPQTAAAAFTLTNAYGYYAVDAAKGAGSTITNLHGLYVADQTQGTNNYGVTSAVTSGTNKWNIYASGTAANYFAGQAQFANGSVGTPSISNINDTNTGIFFPAADTIAFSEGGAETMRIDSSGNMQMQTGAVMPYAPAPASISTTATLTNANIQAQIINTTGTTYTVTMPLGTTLETLATWATTGIGYDFTVINTASGTITMAVNTGVTSLGGLTIATGVSAQFRIRRTAANTFVLYRLS